MKFGASIILGTLCLINSAETTILPYYGCSCRNERAEIEKAKNEAIAEINALKEQVLKEISEARLSIQVGTVTVSVSTKEQAACEQNKGQWRADGLLQNYACIYTYSDGGKPCLSSNDCEGSCIYNVGQTSPSCKSDSSIFGCFIEVENVVAGEQPVILCRD